LEAEDVSYRTERPLAGTSWKLSHNKHDFTHAPLFTEETHPCLTYYMLGP